MTQSSKSQHSLTFRDIHYTLPVWCKFFVGVFFENIIEVFEDYRLPALSIESFLILHNKLCSVQTNNESDIFKMYRFYEFLTSLKYKLVFV